jgi:pyrroline-5-carboxylate reductase
MTVTLGILGVGHMTGAMVEGWGRLPEAERPRFALSPRNAQKAQALAAALGCEVMADNAEVVAKSDIVLLGVRPGQVKEAFEGLPWREGQLALSVIAGVKQSRLEELVAPAKVVRVMPVTACAFGESANALYPADPTAKALMSSLGAVSELEDEEAFDRLAVHGCTYGWLLSLLDDIARWSIEAGIPPETARRHVAQTFRAAGTTALEDSRPVKELVDELGSPGSFTRKGLETLRAETYFDPWQAALDRIRKEYEG